MTGNGEITGHKPDTTLISTFDVAEKGLSPDTTLLDSQLDRLRLEFVTYQRDLSNQVEEALKEDDGTSGETRLERIQSVYETKETFVRILTELFSHTGKKFDERAFHFLKKGIRTPIPPKSLSSGEKQMLIILLTTLLQDGRECTLLMDEPELSLHIDWQRSLIENMRQMNPNCQIIMATHSPTVYYQGWIERVARIEGIRSSPDVATESAILAEKATQSEGRVRRMRGDFRKFSGGMPAKLYQFNRKIGAHTSLTKDECVELLDFLRENMVRPDVTTFATLISKLNRYADAKEIFDLMGTHTHVKPNHVTLNTLIKRVGRVGEGLELVQNVSADENLQLHPDITTFSILLGKARNTDETRWVEEVRNYYGVKANDTYLNKLRFKR